MAWRDVDIPYEEVCSAHFNFDRLDLSNVVTRQDWVMKLLVSDGVMH